ncbi:pentalenene synthase [Fusarium albosuccineum]|uniref:Pentalenene synthase n=1 Tax=Fusarium albosuccineum TaxID=1237068 RepID=A0A8H4LF14_9HYPO|nr:pentalenene synthase [Fusarium albosuccineum]
MAPSSLTTPPPSRSGTETPEHGCLDHIHHADRLLNEPDGRWIKLPEALFSSIMAVEPEINPMYKTSKALSDEWLRNALCMDDKTASIWSRLDIAYMSAICAPHTDVETLKLMNDWNGWVFAFDDPFDEGTFANDPIKAAEEVIYTLATLDNIHPRVSPEENPMRHTLQSCWNRFRKRASPGLQYRWKRHLTMYCVGVLQQVGVQHKASRPTVAEYMDMRAGAMITPCIVSAASAVGKLCTGTHAFLHRLRHFGQGFKRTFHGSSPGIRRARRSCGWLSSSFTPDWLLHQVPFRVTSSGWPIRRGLFEEIIALTMKRTDLIKGEDSNIIFILKDQGMSDQQAVDHIGEMLYDCYRRWYNALINLPFWGEGIDRDVMKFINGCRNIALGNLHWR